MISKSAVLIDLLENLNFFPKPDRHSNAICLSYRRTVCSTCFQVIAPETSHKADHYCNLEVSCLRNEYLALLQADGSRRLDDQHDCRGPKWPLRPIPINLLLLIERSRYHSLRKCTLLILEGQPVLPNLASSQDGMLDQRPTRLPKLSQEKNIFRIIKKTRLTSCILRFTKVLF